MPATTAIRTRSGWAAYSARVSTLVSSLPPSRMASAYAVFVTTNPHGAMIMARAIPTRRAPLVGEETGAD
jgi:hypothetical protein